jgi:two-component system, OmpR family, sensor histidine kinase VicK
MRISNVSWPKRTHGRPWRIIIAAVGGLLVAILVAGIVGLLLNHNVEQVTQEALSYDVDLEDEGDDLRAAVLDVRHYHRNIFYGGPSGSQIEEFESTYVRLDEKIGELEALGVRNPYAPQPKEIREMAEEYYAGFRPAIELYEEDRETFIEASDLGLSLVDEMNRASEELDDLGEQQAEASLARVDQVTQTARVVLLTVIGGCSWQGRRWPTRLCAWSTSYGRPRRRRPTSSPMPRTS